jgi:hypothetical protein
MTADRWAPPAEVTMVEAIFLAATVCAVVGVVLLVLPAGTTWWRRRR